MSKNQLLLIIVLVFGAWQDRVNIKHWFVPLPPIASGKVVLYSTTWCGYCAKTRRYFADNHIPYQDIDIEKTDAGKTAFAGLGVGGGVPVVVVNNTTVIQGYDPDQIDAALEAINQ